MSHATIDLRGLSAAAKGEVGKDEKETEAMVGGLCSTALRCAILGAENQVDVFSDAAKKEVNDAVAERVNAEVVNVIEKFSSNAKLNREERAYKNFETKQKFEKTFFVTGVMIGHQWHNTEERIPRNDIN